MSLFAYLLLLQINTVFLENYFESVACFCS